APAHPPTAPTARSTLSLHDALPILQAHRIKVHLQEKGYACEECNAVLDDSFLLSEHQQLIHGSQRDIFACSICPAKLDQSGECVSHLQDHLVRMTEQLERARSSGDNSGLLFYFFQGGPEFRFTKVFSLDASLD